MMIAAAKTKSPAKRPEDGLHEKALDFIYGPGGPCGPPSPIVDLADRINAEHHACHAAVDSALDHALAAGDMLIQAKSLCVHGDWTRWLADYFEGSDRLARSYMRLARNRQELEAKRQTSAVFDHVGISIEKAIRYLAPPKQSTTGEQKVLPPADHRKPAEISGAATELRVSDFPEDKPDCDVHLEPTGRVLLARPASSQRTGQRRTLSEGRVSALACRAADAALSQLEGTLKRIGIFEHYQLHLNDISLGINARQKDVDLPEPDATIGGAV